MKLEGLTDFQNDLLKTAQQSPKAMKKIMGKAGNKATNTVRKHARKNVKKKSGKYHKKWKRGKVFGDASGDLITRVINSAPHAHLIEDGHEQVMNPPKPNGRGVVPGKGIGEVVGFVDGRDPLKDGMREYDTNGLFEKTIGNGLDELLRKNQL